MSNDSDSNLQKRFDRWREMEHAQAPEFARVWRLAQRRSDAPVCPRAPGMWLRLAGVGASGLIVLTSVWLAIRTPSRIPDSVATANGLNPLPATNQDDYSMGSPPLAWTAPTDFLLATNNDDPVGQLTEEISMLLRQ